MYESFYNFKAEPFRLSPDHRFCFTHKSYAKAKAYMQYAIHRAEGFVMVTGKPGTGKTTLVNDLVDGLSQTRIVVATIVSTQLEADDLLRLVSCNFGLDVDAPNKAVVLQGLSVRLKRHHEEGTRALLIIDEAQDLSASALEELRLLTNLQLNNQPLLQIFLVGQENLRDLVQKPSMEQVHQRLVAACHLESLNEEDTKSYVRHRLERVGWRDDPIIDEGVYSLVYQFSKGIPRRINLICSRFLLHGSVEEKHRIRASDVRTVVDELQHEQLAPVGFKGQLPPLMDDEEDDDDFEPPAVDTDTVVSLVSEENARQGGSPDGKQEQSDTVAQPHEDSSFVETPEAARVDEDSLRVISLEAEVKREESQSTAKSDSTGQDAIQQNYFSLDDAMEAPSEPVPIQTPAAAPGGVHGYGDRFANAQRQSQQSTTRYYSEYQADGSGQYAGNRKRSVLGLAFVFALILGVVLIAVYMIRPQILQSEINYLEEKVAHYLQVVTDGDASGNQDSGTDNPSGDAIPKGETDTAPPQTGQQAVEKPSQADGASAAMASAPVDTLAVDAPKVILDSVPGVPLAAVDESSPGIDIKPELEAVPDTLTDQEAEPLLAASLPDSPSAKKKVNSLLAAEPPVPPETDDSMRSDEGPGMAASPEPASVLESAPEQAQVSPEGQNGKVSLPVPVTGGESGVAADIPASENRGPLNGGSPDTTPGSDHAVPEQVEVASNAAESVIAVEAEQEVMSSHSQVALQSSAPEPPTPPQKKTFQRPGATAEASTVRLFFGSDSSEISTAGKQNLDRIVTRLDEDPDAVAHIVGYADSTGDPAYNLTLSFKRARVVADYLRAHRIGAEQLRVEGRGVYSGSFVGDAGQSQSERSHRLVTVDLLHVTE